MEKPFLTVKEFHNEIVKKKSKKRALKSYFENLNKKYKIPVVKETVIHKCPDEYPENYIVNQSTKRFKNEIAKSHFLAHWNDLCQYPEITSTLRFIYNLINLKKDLLINLLEKITNQSKNIILDQSNKENKDFLTEIINLIGLTNDDISRIKISNKTKANILKLKTSKNLIDNLNNNSNEISYKEIKENTKGLINLSLIINLKEEYPRNLLSCPLDKVILGTRNVKNNALNFMCHTDNKINRLKTDKLCLSVWLLKNTRNNKTFTNIKMGTAYLSDTFPSEKGTINDFIKDVLNVGFNEDAAKYLDKIKEGIENNYFYAIETNDPNFKNLNTSNTSNTLNTLNTLNKKKVKITKKKILKK